MKVIVINGFPWPRSGKSSFVNFCLDELGAWGKEVSTVDFVKELAEQCGWDGTKTPENRKFLSDLKDLLTDWNDVPYKKVIKEKEVWESSFDYFNIPTKDCFFFIHCREPKEIQKFVDRIGAETLLIRRENVEQLEQSNHADSEILNFTYDYEIENNSDLKELKEKAKKFLKERGWKKKW